MGKQDKGFHGSGHVRDYTTKAGVRWRYEIRVPRDPDHPEIGTEPASKAGFATEKDATAAMQKAQRDVARGLRIGSKVPTLAEFAVTWLASLDLGSSTTAGYTRQLNLHVLPRIGHLRLDQIRATTLSTLYKTLATEPPLNAPASGRWANPEPLGANSIRKIATTVGSMLDAAVLDHHIIDNPGKGKAVKRPSKSKVASEAPEMSVWTAEQMSAFLTWDREVRVDSDYPLWALYAASGARRSEVLALRWSDLDLKAGVVHIRRTLDVDRPGQTKKPKSGKARSFGVSPSTVTILRDWRRKLAARDLNLVRPDRWVFPMPGQWERHRNPQSTSQMFSRRVEWAREHLGSDALPSIHLHEVRHSAATILISNGVDPKTVADRLGHESVRITLDIYTHVTKKSDAAAAALLDFG